MWYEDLSPFAGLGADYKAFLLAVGWLERGKAFATGKVEVAVYRRLEELLLDPWEPAIAMGYHSCDLCQYDGARGSKNLYVPADEVVFVAPELVAHYMNAHGYQPPPEFCAAVLKCPDMRSMAYMKAVLKVARPLVRAAVEPRHAEPSDAADSR